MNLRRFHIELMVTYGHIVVTFVTLGCKHGDMCVYMLIVCESCMSIHINIIWETQVTTYELTKHVCV